MRITIEVDSIEKAAALLEAARRLEEEKTRQAIKEAATALERDRKFRAKYLEPESAQGR